MRAKDKPIHTGNPVRADVLAASRTEALRKLGLRHDRLTVAIDRAGVGGQRQSMRRCWSVRDQLRNDVRLQVIHQTGAAGFDAVKERYAQIDIHAAEDGSINDGQLCVVPYLYDMPTVLVAADVVVSCVGFPEITARGLPAILVPYPYAAGDHQTFNARSLVAAGAAHMIADKELTGERLLHTLLPLIEHPDRRQKMAEAAKSLGRPDAANALAELIVDLGKKARRE